MNGSQEQQKEAGAVTSAEIQATADDLLVHALLQGRLQDSPRKRTRRVRRVCRAVKPARASFWRAYWKMELWAAAAALALLLGLWLIPGGTSSAYAGFEEVLMTFETGDKEYAVDIYADAPDSADHRPDAERGGRRRGGGVRSALHLDGAVLYVRGSQSVLKYQGSRGWGVTRGFDGRAPWVVQHHRRQSWISDDSGRDVTEIPDYVHGLMVMNLHGMLNRITQDYRLTGERCGDGGEGALEVYAAQRNSDRPELPEWIRIEFNGATRQVQTIVCGGLALGKRRGQGRLLTLEMRLKGTNPLPADWFSPEAHLRSSGG
ncbi:MAG: hypothetical protein EOM72_01300 [Opitutae bacterium]|nr:hypothetical protein [Opitutae bacterium]